MKFLNTVINGSSSSTAQVATDSTTTVASSGGAGIGGIILYFVVLIAIFYFIVIRPQKKRQKQHVDLLSNIKVDDLVILESGFYGKVVEISEQVYKIEFGINKGVIVPVAKQSIIAKADPSVINS